MRERSNQAAGRCGSIARAFVFTTFALGVASATFAGDTNSTTNGAGVSGAAKSTFVPRLPRASPPLPSTNTGRPFAPVGTGRPFTPVGTGRPFVNDGLPRTPIRATRLTFPPVVPRSITDAAQSAVEAPEPGTIVEPQPEADAPVSVPDSARTQFDPFDSAAEFDDPIIPPQFEELIDRLVSDGRRQLADGEAHAAEASFGGALFYAPRAADLRVLHCLAQIAAGNIDGAAQELHEAVRQRPAVLTDSLDLDGAYGGRKGLETVVKQLDDFLAAYPLKSDARFLGAFLLYHAGDVATARTAIDTLIEHDPKYPHAARLREAVVATVKIDVRDA